MTFNTFNSKGQSGDVSTVAGADQLMIGVASLVTCFSEFVMFFFVGPIIKCKPIFFYFLKL